MNCCAASPRKRETESGFVVVDKPAGITSHDVVDRVRRLVGARRVGHGGTLDPLATGVLLIAVGKATGLFRFLALEPKVYRAGIRLGVETSTLDADGERVGEEKPVHLTRTDVESALTGFRGTIEQTPPMVSALKVNGVALHRLARRGLNVARSPRRVQIHELSLADFEPPEATLQVTCSAGTYVRALAADIGRRLGCGAHLTALRRTAVGGYTVEAALPLADDRIPPAERRDLMARGWIRMEEALAHLPGVVLSQYAARRLACGMTMDAEREAADALAPIEPGSALRLLNEAEELVAVAVRDEEDEEGLSRLSLQRVLMDPEPFAMPEMNAGARGPGAA